MMVADLGEIFIDNIVAGRIEVDQNSENQEVPDNEDFVNDASCFTTATVDSVTATNIYGNHDMGPGDEREANSTNQDSENGANSQNLRPPTAKMEVPGDLMQINISSSPNVPNEKNNHQTASDDNDPSIPNGRSLAHFNFEQNNVVFVSFDIKTGGEVLRDPSAVR